MVVVQEVGGSSPLAHPIFFADPVEDPELTGSFHSALLPGQVPGRGSTRRLALGLPDVLSAAKPPLPVAEDLGRIKAVVPVGRLAALEIGPPEIYYSGALRSIISTCPRK